MGFRLPLKQLTYIDQFQEMKKKYVQVLECNKNLVRNLFCVYLLNFVTFVFDLLDDEVSY
jgi:hypothetical protein